MRSKISTTNFSKTRTMPKVFTEQGVYMLATVSAFEILSQILEDSKHSEDKVIGFRNKNKD